MNDKAIMLSPFSSIQEFNDSHQMADALAHSSFVPAKFRGNLPNCIQALGISARLGVDPLSVMNALYEVHGKIGFSSKFLIATVNASGKFDPIRWKFFGTPGKPVSTWDLTATSGAKSLLQKILLLPARGKWTNTGTVLCSGDVSVTI